jgi:hypothetical protein
MRRLYVLIICCWMGFTCLNAYGSKIEYNVNNLGSSRFEYEYTITNDTLSVPIEEFTLWFDVDLYDNLIITTADSLASQWNEIVLQDTGFGVPIGYDSLSETGGLLPTQRISGFSVSFDWLGSGQPSSQFFEIINPTTFETVDSGYTIPIPEPATMLLIGLGGIFFRRRM